MNFEYLKAQEMLNLKSIAYEKQIDEYKLELFNYNDTKKREKIINEKYNKTVTDLNLLSQKHEKLLNEFNEKIKQLQMLDQRYQHTNDENRKIKMVNNDLEKNLSEIRNK